MIDAIDSKLLVLVNKLGFIKTSIWMAGNLSSVAVVLTLEPALESPKRACSNTSPSSTPEFLSQQVWRGTWAFAFVASSQMMLMLMVRRPDFEKSL